MRNDGNTLAIMVLFEKCKKVRDARFYVLITFAVWKWLCNALAFLHGFDDIRRRAVQFSIVTLAQSCVWNDLVHPLPRELCGIMRAFKVRTKHNIEFLLFRLFFQINGLPYAE